MQVFLYICTKNNELYFDQSVNRYIVPYKKIGLLYSPIFYAIYEFYGTLRPSTFTLRRLHALFPPL